MVKLILYYVGGPYVPRMPGHHELELGNDMNEIVKYIYYIDIKVNFIEF